MKKKKKKDEWTPESFPQPRTFPSGWDGEALRYTNGHPIVDDEKRESPMVKDDPNWRPEKFPKPKTFPKKWSIDD